LATLTAMALKLASLEAEIIYSILHFFNLTDKKYTIKKIILEMGSKSGECPM